MPRAIYEQTPLVVEWPEISIRDVGDIGALSATISHALPHVSVSNHEEIRAVALDVFDRTFLLSKR